MPSVTLATCADYPDGDEDAEALGASLRELGVTARWAVWNDPGVAWDLDLVVLRSTWDYTAHLAQFLAWADAVPRLVNDAGTVRWSTDKVYLRDLDAAGIPIVPTTFAAPGETITPPDADEFVVKPSVGAGSRGAARFTADRLASAREHAASLQDGGRTVLVQPYLGDVDTDGETALVYVDGTFSHAARKGALLPAGVVHPLGGHQLFVEETMEPRVPSPEQRDVADAALAAVTDRLPVPLYARVDLLPGPDGPVVIELELAEPSLFLGYAMDASDAVQRLAAAIARRL